jgi:hypothetical protein
MRKVILSIAVFSLVAFTGTLLGQATLESADASMVDAHDRPVGKLTMTLPSSDSAPPPAPPGPGVCSIPKPIGHERPPIEVPPNTEPDEKIYIGEQFGGKVVFLLDASGSMYGSRIATVRSETTSAINAMEATDEFDCVAYGSQFPQSQDYSSYMWGSLRPGTSGNKASAVAWVNGPTTNPGGGTPTYSCLKSACTRYPADLNQMFLLTDGSPNTSGTATQILADFPMWWTKFPETDLICICMGGSGAAQTFMQQLAAIAGGSYIAI